jgi:hypothetical protein
VPTSLPYGANPPDEIFVSPAGIRFWIEGNIFQARLSFNPMVEQMQFRAQFEQEQPLLEGVLHQPKIRLKKNLSRRSSTRDSLGLEP